MNLKELRKKNKKSQKEIADYIGVTQSNYSKYEQGTIEPNINQICLLAKLYNTTTDELLGMKKENPELTERNVLLNKINLLTEYECHKLNIFADGLISNRAEEQKEKTFTIIKNIENEELNEMFSKLSFGEQNEVLGYIQKKIKLKEEEKEKK